MSEWRIFVAPRVIKYIYVNVSKVIGDRICNEVKCIQMQTNSTKIVKILLEAYNHPQHQKRMGQSSICNGSESSLVSVEEAYVTD